MAQVGDTLKANTARSEALAQRVDAMKKDIDDVKNSLDEDRQNISKISPGPLRLSLRWPSSYDLALASGG